MEWLDNRTWIAFDVETTGSYPVADEVVEIGAIKFKGSDPIDTFQSLIKPRRPMPQEIINIHGITNEMVVDAPSAATVARKVLDFFRADFFVAHHAPFDMGFMAEFFESQGLSLPAAADSFCTSLLSRKLVTDVPNHKLQTLAEYFHIDMGQAHRALDDARTCGRLFLAILKRNPQVKEDELRALQQHRLNWQRFSIKSHRHPDIHLVYEACRNGLDLEIEYERGLNKGRLLRIRPLGIVLTPLDGDYVPSWCYWDQRKRRLQLDFLSHCRAPQNVS